MRVFIGWLCAFGFIAYIIFRAITPDFDPTPKRAKHAPDIIAGQIQAYADLGWTCYTMRQDEEPSASIMVITVGCKR